MENWKTAETFQRAEFRTRRLTAAKSLDETEDLLDFAIALRDSRPGLRRIDADHPSAGAPTETVSIAGHRGTVELDLPANSVMFLELRSIDR